MTWKAPEHWLRLASVDAHTAGEPLRVITEGYPTVPGDTILEKRRHAREHLDHLRRLLMWEPRGHADMYGALPVDPVTPDGDVGVLFLHNEGYSTMCGHGIIGLVKVGLEAGLFSAKGDPPVVRIDTPAGRVTATALLLGGCVEEVSFLNVPSFVVDRDIRLDVPGVGRVTLDIAYGGAFYAYVEAAPLGLELVPDEMARLIDVGMRVKETVMASCDLRHPTGSEDLEFLYGTIFVEPRDGDIHSRNICIFADGEVDRSPTGTGVSGRIALHHGRGEVAVGEEILIESIIGTSFRVAVAETTKVGERDAVVPRVTGTAHVTGQHTFVLDPDDPLQDGFLVAGRT